MNDAVNQTTATASLHEEGDALFDTRLVNAITSQREITHGENFLALKSAFTGMYVNLKSIADLAKREEALAQDTLDARVEQVFTHATQDQDITLKNAFVETLAAAVRDPQAGAYAIKQLADQKKQADANAEADALRVLLVSQPAVAALFVTTTPSVPSVTFEDNSQSHTHQYASDDASPRARNFRRFVRTGLAVIALGVGGLFYQNSNLSDKADKNAKETQGIVSKGDSTIISNADSIGTHLHDDANRNKLEMREFGRNRANEIKRAIRAGDNRVIKAVGDSLGSMQENLTPVVADSTKNAAQYNNY